jgi:cell division control protein 6
MEKLSFDYVPSRLPHRESEVNHLVNTFRVAIESLGALSQRILIVGDTGTGKTATAKKVGATLQKIAENKGLKLKYAHVNCRLVHSKFGLVQDLIRQAAPELPSRGYGPVELLHALRDFLNERNSLLILTLDEVDHYIKMNGEEIIYELTRLTEPATNVPQRINFIFIARNRNFISLMSSTTLSKFRPQETLEFPPYKENQLKDILMDRVKEAFKENAVNEEIVEFVARNAATYGHGDARYALQLLLTAGMIADREGSRFVLPEHVREAQEKTDPRLRDEDIAALPVESKLALLALARCLMKEEATYISFESLDKMYEIIREEYNVKSIRKTLSPTSLKNLQLLGIINIDEKLGAGLPFVKAEALEKFLANLLRTEHL